MSFRPRESLKGVASAALAFLLWGLIPLFWKLLVSVPAYELVLHRVFWSLVFLLLLIKFRGRFGMLVASMRDRRMLVLHGMGGFLLVFNWSAFIVAVTGGQVLQASLAYFMVPLVNSALGFLVLKERLSAMRAAAVLLAGIGVFNEVFNVSEVPWLAIAMAGSFGLYGLLKKKSTLGTVTGLTVENAVVFPLAGAALLHLFLKGEGALFYASWQMQCLVVSIGLVTSVPLLLFSYGAARIELNTLGILQFIGPIMKFFLAVVLFDEPFSSSKLLTFLAIWIGLLLYLWDSFRSSRPKDVQPDL